jgi:hypothetical protein
VTDNKFFAMQNPFKTGDIVLTKLKGKEEPGDISSCEAHEGQYLVKNGKLEPYEPYPGHVFAGLRGNFFVFGAAGADFAAPLFAPTATPMERTGFGSTQWADSKFSTSALWKLWKWPANCFSNPSIFRAMGVRRSKEKQHVFSNLFSRVAGVASHSLG